MKNVMKLILLTFSSVFIAVAGIIIGYFYFTNPSKINNLNIENNVSENSLTQLETTILPTYSPEYPPLDPIDDVPIVFDNTKIVFEFLYEGDGHIEKSVEDVPYFLIGSTQEEVMRIFNDWELLSFSDNEIVMRKAFEGKGDEHYILGVFDGYVAVFYQDKIKGSSLKEITDTPVSALSPDERQRLSAGIEVIGDNNLVKIIEDYGS